MFPLVHLISDYIKQSYLWACKSENYEPTISKPEAQFDLNQFVSTPGLQYVAENILSRLDSNSLAECRMVSKPFKELIDNKKNLIQLQIHQVKLKKYSEAESHYQDSTELLFQLLLENTIHEDLRTLLKFMKETWSKVDSKSSFARTAVAFNCNDVIQIILSNKFTNNFLLNWADENEKTVLEYACELGKVEILEKLLTYNEIREKVVEQISERNFEVLNLACKNGHLNIVEAIIKCCVENGRRNILDITGSLGYFPLHFACENGHTNIVRYFLKNNSTLSHLFAYTEYMETPLHTAAIAGRLDVVKIITEYCVSIGQEYPITPPGDAPVHYACNSGQIEIIKYFLHHHQTFNLTSQSQFGTLIHLACSKRNVAIVKILVEFAIEHNQPSLLNIPNSIGETPFNVACIMRHTDIVQYFLLHHYTIDLTAQDNNGQTPFSEVCWSHQIGSDKIVKILVDFAIEHERLDVVALSDQNWREFFQLHPFLATRIEIRKLFSSLLYFLQ